LDWRQLASVVREYGSHFNHINAAAALVHLAQLGPGPSQPTPGSSSKADAAAWDAYAAYEALLQELVQTVHQFAVEFGARQVCNAMWAAARLSRNHGAAGHPLCSALLDQLLPYAKVQQPWANAQELSICLWAVAVGGLSPDDDWLEGWLLAFETALPQAAPQHLATCMWSLAQLGVAPDHEWVGALSARAAQIEPGFTARDAAQTLAGAAALSLNLHAAAPQLQRGLRARLLEAVEQEWEDAQYYKEQHHMQLPPDRRASPAFSQAVIPGLEEGVAATPGQAAAHALACGIWALASLSCVPTTAWMERAYALVEAHLHDFTAQGLATVVWGAVSLGQPLPPRLLRALYAATSDAAVLATWPPQSLSSLVWAVSVADAASSSSSSTSRPLAPPSAWCAAFYSAVEHQLHSWNGQQVSMTLVGLARMGVTPDAQWATSLVSHLCTACTHVSPQPLANTLWALAKLGFNMNEGGLAAVTQLLTSRLVTANGSASDSDSCDAALIGSYMAVGASPGSTPLLDPSSAVLLAAGSGSDAVTAGTAGVTADLNHQELANVWYALARFKHMPEPSLADALLAAAKGQYDTMAAAAPQAVQRPGSPTAGSGRGVAATVTAVTAGAAYGIKSQELANTLWALATLGVQPSDAWLRSYWSACMKLLPSFNAKDLAQTVYALAKLGRVPPTASPAASQAGAAAETTQDAAGWAWPNLASPQQLRRSAAATAAAVAASASVSGGQGVAPATTGSSWAGRLLAEAAATLQRGNSQDMANLLWGLAQLGVMPGVSWCNKAAAELCMRCESFAPAHLATCLWALGRCGHAPADGALTDVEGALYRHMGSLGPRELAALMSAFSAMRYTPVAEFTQAYIARCLELAHQFKQKDWGVVLPALAGVVAAKPTQGELVVELLASPELEAAVKRFGPGGVALVAHAAGLMGASTAAPAARRLLSRTLDAAKPNLSKFSSTELGALMVAAARINAQPKPAFMAAWMAAVGARLGAPAPSVTASGSGDAEVMAVSGSESEAGQNPAAEASPSKSSARTSSTNSQEQPEVQAAGWDPQWASSAGAEHADAGLASPASESDSEASTSSQVSSTSIASPASLSGSTVVVVGWSLAKLGLRPKSPWRAAWSEALSRSVHSLTPVEVVMAAWALGAWGSKVDRDVVVDLADAAERHKPLYDKPTRRMLRGLFATLKELSWMEA